MGCDLSLLEMPSYFFVIHDLVLLYLLIYVKGKIYLILSYNQLLWN